MKRQPYPIIDFHIHPYQSEGENLCMYTEALALSTAEAMEDLKSSGITHVCGSVIEKREQGSVTDFAELRRCNRIALAIKEQWGDFYTPGFHIHPAFVKESLEEMEFMHKRGVRLIGELVPYMHGWKETGHDYASSALQEILALAGDYGMVVSYHTMTEEQEQMEYMIRHNPGVTFVAAHPGQREDYLLQLERMKKYENMYLDLSGTGLFRYGMLAAGVKAVGAERLLFGTDYPIINPSMYVQAVLGEHVSEEAKEKIFYKNARRLLAL